MSVSIDDEVAEGGEDARGVLASWLDDYSEGRCDLEDVRDSFLSVCRSDPDAPWDALALLDQYTRRGRIEPQLAQSLKSEIEKLVFGVGQSPATLRRSPPTTAKSEPLRADPASDDEDLSDDEAPDEGDIVRPTPDSTSDLIPDPARSKPARPSHSGASRDRSRESDATGPWRRLTAERDSETTRPGTAFIERTGLRDAVDAPRDRIGAVTPAIQRTPAPSAHRETTVRVLRDRYELQSVLGRSRSGTVYRAVDRRRAHLSESARCVAVKVLNGDYAHEPASLAELERQFHQAQSLAHPNIVSVFDLDRDGDTWFIVMEVLHGQLLAQILRKLMGAPMRREHAFAIVSGVGAALAHAHRRDVIHADLKPSAIMITESGETRVLDFGFARERAFDLHTASHTHEAPEPSPAYASVERINGSEPDASDDVYSLACIAYELLSGQHPFGGRSALLARTHRRKPPRVRGLTQKQWQTLRRALLWTRGERKIDVLDFLNGLGCAETSAVHTSPEEILAPTEGSSRWLRTAAWAACLVASGAAAFYFLPSRSPQSDAAIDVKPAQRAHVDNPPPQPVPATAAGKVEPSRERQVKAESPQVQPAEAKAGSEKNAATQAKKTTAASTASAPAQQRRAEGESGAAAVVPTIQFDQDTYVANEGDGSVRLRVKRSGSTSAPTRFNWSLRTNSAEAGADFAAIGPGFEEIPRGAREVSLTIPLVSDGLVENTELFLVELQSDDAASLGERSHVAVIIVDDD